MWRRCTGGRARGGAWWSRPRVRAHRAGPAAVLNAFLINCIALNRGERLPACYLGLGCAVGVNSWVRAPGDCGPACVCACLPACLLWGARVVWWACVLVQCLPPPPLLPRADYSTKQVLLCFPALGGCRALAGSPARAGRACLACTAGRPVPCCGASCRRRRLCPPKAKRLLSVCICAALACRYRY